MTSTFPAGVEINAPDPARLRSRAHDPGTRARRQAAPRFRAAPARAAGRACRGRQAARCRREARFPERHESHPRKRLADRARARGTAVPPGRDHRPGRRQDGHQRLQFGRRFVHDRFRGQQLAAVGQPDPGPDQHLGGDPAHPHLLAGLGRGHQELQAQREDRHAAGAPARLAPRREARADRRRPRLRRPVRFRPLHVPQRQGAAGARLRALLLPAQAREPPRGAALERGLRDDPGGPRPAAGHDQGDGAHRDHQRRLRDGRDPLRAARALGRAQRRPLGLHLQLHQEVQDRPRFLPRRPAQGDDDGALHARLRACCC